MNKAVKCIIWVVVIALVVWGAWALFSNNDADVIETPDVIEDYTEVDNIDVDDVDTDVDADDDADVDEDVDTDDADVDEDAE